MSKITLRIITRQNFQECINLKVSEDQVNFVAPNVYSLAQAYVNPLLEPYAIYDRKVLTREPGPEDPMIGFIMLQRMEGIGFIMRLMVDERFQQQGYGRAAMVEIIRRLKMDPAIEYIATSVTKGNDVVEKFYRSLGFVDGDKLDEREIYLKLDWSPTE